MEGIKLYSTVSLTKLFHMTLTRQALIAAERHGHIPTAKKYKRGSLESRAWTIEQLPQIGERFGFLKKPTSPLVISVFTPKGGVLKTTICFNFARILALHNIKCLIVGLDSQSSITELILNPMASVQSIEDLPIYKGLSESFSDRNFKNISDYIMKTQLPSLDIIPETPGLAPLTKRMKTETRSEYIFREKLLPQVKDKYDVVFFDCSPSWSILAENALCASDVILSPIGCEPGSYQAIDSNIDLIADFKEQAIANWKHWFLIPTYKDNTNLSDQIHRSYIDRFRSAEKYKLTFASLRRSLVGAESYAAGISILEYDTKSALCHDYCDLIIEVWRQISGIGEA